MIKKPKLEPLQVSDVLGALVRQDRKPDKTAYYRSLLYPSQSQFLVRMPPVEPLNLPDFATKQLSEADLFALLQQRTHAFAEYESSLQSVNKRIKSLLVTYHDNLKEGQSTIGELIDHGNQAHTVVRAQRASIKNMKQQMKQKYARVASKLTKIKNMEKVIGIIGVWGDLKLGFLLGVNTNQPQLYDVSDVIRLIEEAQAQLLRDESSPDTMLKQVSQRLEKKKKQLIRSIYVNFQESVIHFTNSTDYKQKFLQYSIFKGHYSCPDLLNHSQIQVLIKQNASTMFYTILKKLTPLANVDLLNEATYLSFFDEVIEEFVIYFRSWHYVTKYHIEEDNQYGRLFMENRRHVYRVLSESLGSSIEHSKKFISLQYKVKLELVEKFSDYLEAGEKWMGKCESIKLQQILSEKLKKQLQNLFKLYNNLIKNILTQQLSVDALQPTQSPSIPPPTIQPVINNVKLLKFLNPSEPQHQPLTIPPLPATQLKLGNLFLQMITEYIQRSQYLQTNSSIYMDNIIQHFEFILFMMYQVCVKSSVKDRNVYNIRQRVSEVEQAKSDETLLRFLHEIVRDVSHRRKFMRVFEFLDSIGSKFDGVQIAGIIDVNKLYESGNDDLIGSYTKLVLRIVSDLEVIVDWIIPISHRIGQHSKSTYLRHLPTLLREIFSLSLENNTEHLTQKYLSNIPPMVGKLKWELKKFNQQTATLYKDYKLKTLELYRSSTLLMMVRNYGGKELCQMVENRELEVLYRCLVEVYSRIEKINDNGRQLIRLDAVEIGRILAEMGVQVDFWMGWLNAYLEIVMERNTKQVIEKVRKAALQYSPLSWRCPLMWVITDFSSKEKKEYINQLIKLYISLLKNTQL